MVEVVFAKAFRRHVDCPTASVVGDDVREVLDAYFEAHPATRGYRVRPLLLTPSGRPLDGMVSLD